MGLIWQVTVGDGHGGAMRVEFADEPACPGDLQDSVTVLRRSATGNWVRHQPARVVLLPAEERTLYNN
jgi:hypothetical protein